MKKNIFARWTFAATAAVAALGLVACSGGATGSAEGGQKANPDWPDSITFASIPYEGSTSLNAYFGPTLEILKKELGIDVEVQEVTSYAAVIEALRAGQVGIGQLGPFSYVVAADGDAGVKPVGTVANSKDEPPTYNSLGIVPADSDIKDLAGYRGKKVCFVDPTSTSGFLFPSAGLLENDIDPDSDDIEKVMAGGHDSSALSVQDKTCDAGFVASTTLQSMKDEGQIKEGALKEVWKSEDIPGSPVVVSTKLPEDLQEEITRIFLEEVNKPALVEAGVCDSEENCEMPDDADYGFVPVEDSTYDGIRKVCDITKSESCVA